MSLACQNVAQGKCFERQQELAIVGPRDRAGEGIRTLNISLGKAALCQLSYTREWCLLNIAVASQLASNPTFVLPPFGKAR